MNAKWIPLTELPRELAKLTGGIPPSYRQCYFAVLDGRVKGVSVGGRYRIPVDQLPAIAEQFGLPVPA